MRFSDSAYVALLLALVVAMFGSASFIYSSRRASVALARAGYRSVIMVGLLLTYASFILFGLILGHDFSVAYVAEVSNRVMSTSALLSAFWGGQPGSLMIWAWTLSLFTIGVVAFHRRRYPRLLPAVLAVLLGIQGFFLLVLCLAASPFDRLPSPVADGQGLNPLLLDDAMRIHPPLVLSGYMSFSIPFAFAMGALITGRLGNEWLRPVRLWTMLAWAIQGMGLLVGAWWAYHVLGWGGYWGWDPVENVALLPWLISTALLHSFMVQEKRGMLKLWNLGLVIAAFALSIFGTFVVRSGIIVSVHSFATSAVGPYFFVFLGLVLLGAIALVGYRLPMLRDDASFDSLASREAAFLLNNLLFVCIAAATFWGTIFPIVSEAIRGAKIAVGPPFYLRFNGPLLIALLLLMSVGPLFGWRRTSSSQFFRNMRWPIATGAVVGLALLLFGVQVGLALVGFAASAMVIATIAVEYERGVRARRRAGEPVFIALRTLVSRDRRRYGGYLVHLAMVLIAVGVIGSTGYQQMTEQQLPLGGMMTVGRYTLVNMGLRGYERPGLQGVAADVAVRVGNRNLGVLHPEKRAYANWERQPVTGVAIQTVLPWFDDIYVLMSGFTPDGAMTLRVYVNPLVCFVWLGGGMFLAATVLAAWPGAPERRTPIQQSERREVAHTEA